MLGRQGHPPADAPSSHDIVHPGSKHPDKHFYNGYSGGFSALSRCYISFIMLWGSGLDTHFCPYWLYCVLLAGAGAAVLTFVVCIVVLCSLFILLSQYIMRVHFANRDSFGVGELLIVALRRSTTRSTYRLYRQDRIVSVTYVMARECRNG